MGRFRLSYLGALIFTVFAGLAQAQEVWISEDLPYLDFEVNGEFYLIERGNDNSEFIAKVFPPKERLCPPNCLQPVVPAEGVTPVGETELVNFIEDFVIPGEGFLIDARVESWNKSGTIPGSVNLPFNMFAPSDLNPFIDQLLALFGGVLQTDGTWDFTNAKPLLLFCNGADCGQSPRAIQNLLLDGYPAEKLYYYRGGMQDWVRYGFTIHFPE